MRFWTYYRQTGSFSRKCRSFTTFRMTSAEVESRWDYHSEPVNPTPKTCAHSVADYFFRSAILNSGTQGAAGLGRRNASPGLTKLPPFARAYKIANTRINTGLFRILPAKLRAPLPRGHVR